MKICFITSSRADYGLIKPVIDEALTREELNVRLIVTGTHLSKDHGFTVDEIKKDGLKISAQILMVEKGDSSTSVVKSMGNELLGLADALERLAPDLVVIPGDRYEMLAAASACLVSRIPIAHVYGGDVTEGAFDDAIRHAITKMSHLHFVSNEDSRRRVIQMGETPQTVFNTGSPSLDKIGSLKLVSREELAKDLGIKFREYNLLVTYHPVTLGEDNLEEFVDNLTKLDAEKHSIIITMPNADPGNAKIREAYEKLKSRENIYVFESLGYLRYLSLMAVSSMVVGNSSSGLYEGPSFKIPTVNIGSRQKGRLLAESVISCTTTDMLQAIEKAKKLDCASVKNPYGSGDASKQIIDIIMKAKPSVIKKFHDIYNS